jgi:NTE family protein
LYDRQVSPPPGKGEIMAVLEEGALAEVLRAVRNVTPRERRVALGRRALEVTTVSEAERREVIAWRLPSPNWAPDRDLRIVAIDAETGDTRVFDRNSGVDLVDAVAASCAVPTIWPPTTIGSRRYVDGGIRSATNADLAAGDEPILILAPLDELAGISDPGVLSRIDTLIDGGRAVVIRPDEASVAAIGTNPLDPSARGPAVRAGRAQGRVAAELVRQHWPVRA